MLFEKLSQVKSKLSSNNQKILEKVLLIDENLIDSNKSKVVEDEFSIVIKLYSIHNKSCPLSFFFKKGVDNESDKISLYFLIPQRDEYIHALHYEDVSSSEGLKFYRSFINQILESEIARTDKLVNDDLYSSKLICSEVPFGNDTDLKMPFYGKFKSKWFWQKRNFREEKFNFEPWKE